MKKKINLQFMFISAVGILLTFCLSTVIFYELFKSEVVDELKTYADVIKETHTIRSCRENTILMWMTSGSQ